MANYVLRCLSWIRKVGQTSIQAGIGEGNGMGGKPHAIDCCYLTRFEGRLRHVVGQPAACCKNDAVDIAGVGVIKILGLSFLCNDLSQQDMVSADHGVLAGCCHGSG